MNNSKNVFTLAKLQKAVLTAAQFKLNYIKTHPKLFDVKAESEIMKEKIKLLKGEQLTLRMLTLLHFR